MTAVFVEMKHRPAGGIPHLNQAVIHLRHIRVGVAALGTRVQIEKRRMVPEVLFAEILSPHLVLIQPERGRLNACRAKQFRIFRCDIKRLQTTERRARYGCMQRVGIDVVVLLNVRHQRLRYRESARRHASLRSGRRRC